MKTPDDVYVTYIWHLLITTGARESVATQQQRIVNSEQRTANSKQQTAISDNGSLILNYATTVDQSPESLVS